MGRQFSLDPASVGSNHVWKYVLLCETMLEIKCPQSWMPGPYKLSFVQKQTGQDDIQRLGIDLFHTVINIAYTCMLVCLHISTVPTCICCQPEHQVNLLRSIDCEDCIHILRMQLVWSLLNFKSSNNNHSVLPYKVKTQYLQISNVIDTSINSIKHPISGQSTRVAKGCMSLCLIW